LLQSKILRYLEREERKMSWRGEEEGEREIERERGSLIFCEHGLYWDLLL
jgi:lauroyl/myristoyl acyltransferase